MYWLLGFIFGMVCCNCWLIFTILYKLDDIAYKVNEIKKYQYTNNLKMVGLLKREQGGIKKYDARN